MNWLGAADYAYIPRAGTRVAYYNAQYVRALGWPRRSRAGTATRSARDRWRPRAATARPRSARVLGSGRRRVPGHDRRSPTCMRWTETCSRSSPGWRPRAGTVGARIHRPDDAAGEGDSIADVDVWRRQRIGPTVTSGGFYPFVSYFDLLARFSAATTAARWN